MTGESASAPRLRRTLGPVTLWGLGVGYVISGEYFGWNLGLPLAGTYGMLAATVAVSVMYLTFVFSYAELACAIPRAGGAFVYCTPGAGAVLGLPGRAGADHRVRVRAAGHRHGHRRLPGPALHRPGSAAGGHRRLPDLHRPERLGRAAGGAVRAGGHRAGGGRAAGVHGGGGAVVPAEQPDAGPAARRLVGRAGCRAVRDLVLSGHRGGGQRRRGGRATPSATWPAASARPSSPCWCWRWGCSSSASAWAAGGPSSMPPARPSPAMPRCRWRWPRW